LWGIGCGSPAARRAPQSGHLRRLPLSTQQCLLASIGGCIAAAAAAWEHGIAGSLSSGLHHARRSSGAGYCAVNGVALAALTFVDLGASRVLVVDLDAHCGGGTASILGGDPRISSIDISTGTVALAVTRSDQGSTAAHN